MKKSYALVAVILVALFLPAAPQQAAQKEYIYVLKPGRADLLITGHTPAERVIQDKHSEYLDQMAKKGVLILYGRTLTTDDSTFGIVIFRAASDEEARKVMNGDPGVQGKLMTAKLYPYRVAWREMAAK